MREEVRMPMKPVRHALAGCAVAALMASPAHAQTYGFDCVSDNNAQNCATGEEQFTLTLSQGAGYIDLTLRNLGPITSAVTAVYFDWAGTNTWSTQISGSSYLTDTSGVDFYWHGSPSNLPAGNNATPDFESDLNAVAANPRPLWGINANEYLPFRFFTNATTYASMLDSGAFRVGVHVQSFPNGGSESFVSRTMAGAVPEPETYAMMLAGLAMVGAAARRKQRRG
jgi:hypothetical protein